MYANETFLARFQGRESREPLSVDGRNRWETNNSLFDTQASHKAHKVESLSIMPPKYSSNKIEKDNEGQRGTTRDSGWEVRGKEGSDRNVESGRES